MFSHNEKDFRKKLRHVFAISFLCVFLSFIRSLCPAQTWNSQFCSRHSFQENPEFISRPKAKPKRSQKRSLISKKRPFTRPGPTLNEAAARDMQNNPHGPKWHIQIPDLPRTRPDAHVVQMHNAQINFSYCWQSILNKYTTHGIEIRIWDFCECLDFLWGLYNYDRQNYQKLCKAKPEHQKRSLQR